MHEGVCSRIQRTWTQLSHVYSYPIYPLHTPSTIASPDSAPHRRSQLSSSQVSAVIGGTTLPCKLSAGGHAAGGLSTHMAAWSIPYDCSMESMRWVPHTCSTMAWCPHCPEASITEACSQHHGAQLKGHMKGYVRGYAGRGRHTLWRPHSAL